MAKKKTTTKKKAKRKAASQSDGRRKRGRKPYPVMTFEEVLQLAQGIMEYAAGHPIKRLTLLEKLKFDSGALRTRNLITNSKKYGLTQGSYAAEEIKLTALGRTAISGDGSRRKRTDALFKLAIESVKQLASLYERFKANKLPAREVMRDRLEDLHEGDRQQCVDIFISNAKTVGLLKTISGAERLLSIEQLLDELASISKRAEGDEEGRESSIEESPMTDADFDRICFFIAPIGKEGDEERKHSDMLLSSFVERALEGQKLAVIRADKINKAGMISKQVIEYILKSKLVVADLSFQNPNVFYELALRHVTGKPTVHLIRAEDKIPFDIENFRTIKIDMACKYDLVARIDTYCSEIANHVRQALTDGVSNDNPVLTFFPDVRVSAYEQK